jgi:hypothetical protein
MLEESDIEMRGKESGENSVKNDQCQHEVNAIIQLAVTVNLVLLVI